ncbi:MAG: hypothetical protein KJS97_05405 [Alphaproteobacteria bacterium]|nr:hypothetical protein [Alphaproteobacteria bacterium]
MAVFAAFPLLFIPVAIYAVFAFGAGPEMAAGLAQTAMTLPMASGVRLTVTWGHLLLMFATLLLFIEIVKSIRPTRTSLVDNGLSIGVFILCLVLFILLPGFATSEFFILLLMSLLDFLAGSVIMLGSAQRTVQFGSN